MITDLLCIMFTAVFIVDLSGFRETFLGWLSRWLGHKVTSFRPFTCSLCVTWWGCLAYLLATGTFTLEGVALAGAAALLTVPTAQLAAAVLELLARLINLLTK